MRTKPLTTKTGDFQEDVIHFGMSLNTFLISISHTLIQCSLFSYIDNFQAPFVSNTMSPHTVDMFDSGLKSTVYKILYDKYTVIFMPAHAIVPRGLPLTPPWGLGSPSLKRV